MPTPSSSPEAYNTAEIAARLHEATGLPTEPSGKLPHVRWMIRRDMPEVLRIEADMWEEPWSEQRFLRELRESDKIGMVAEGASDRIVGFMIYQLHAAYLGVVNVGAAGEPDAPASTIHALSHKLAGSLTAHRRTHVRMDLAGRRSRRSAEAIPAFPAVSCSGVSEALALLDDADERVGGFADAQTRIRDVVAEMASLAPPSLAALFRTLAAWTEPLTRVPDDRDGRRFVRARAAQVRHFLLQLEAAAVPAGLYESVEALPTFEAMELSPHVFKDLPRMLERAGFVSVHPLVPGMQWIKLRDPSAPILGSTAGFVEFDHPKNGFRISSFLISDAYRGKGAAAVLAAKLARNASEHPSYQGIV